MGKNGHFIEAGEKSGTVRLNTMFYK